MTADVRSILVAFTGLVTGGLFFAVSLLDGANYLTLAAFAMTLFCGTEFVRQADFDALS
jgi:hypothetical protein